MLHGFRQRFIDPPELLSTALFFLSAFSLPLCIFIRWSHSVTTTVNKWRLAFACRGDVGSFNTKNFFSEGQKNLVNLENKENLSNYQLLKREPSICSTSLHFSKLITVVQFFSRNTGSPQVLIKFWRGNFRGRRPGTRALRMLLRLTAVKPKPNREPVRRLLSNGIFYTSRVSLFADFGKLPFALGGKGLRV